MKTDPVIQFECIGAHESNISPPMKVSVTLPISVDGRRSSVSVYVAVTPFDFETPTHEQVDLLNRVVRWLENGTEAVSALRKIVYDDNGRWRVGIHGDEDVSDLVSGVLE